MTDPQEPIRVHVHWAMKVIAVLEVVIFPYQAYIYWQRDLPITSIALVLLGLLAVWVFFLADSTIDVDRDQIRLMAPHGVYAMYWDEVKSFETKGQAAYFTAKTKRSDIAFCWPARASESFKRTWQN